MSTHSYVFTKLRLKTVPYMGQLLYPFGHLQDERKEDWESASFLLWLEGVPEVTAPPVAADHGTV